MARDNNRFPQWGHKYKYEDMKLPEEFDQFILGGTEQTVSIAADVPVYSLDGMAEYIQERDSLDSRDDAIDAVVEEFGSKFLGHTTPIFVRTIMGE